METQLKVFLKQIKAQESAISMVFGALMVLVVAILLVDYYRDSNALSIIQSKQTLSDVSSANNSEQSAAEDTMQTDSNQTMHTVQKGEHLWAIAEKYYGSGYNHIDIAEANKLSLQTPLSVGQALVIPKVTPKKPTSSKIIPSVQSNEKNIATQTSSEKSYTVKPGDTLWNIALKVHQNGYRWSEIYQDNKHLIQNPSIIETGWVLSIR